MEQQLAGRLFNGQAETLAKATGGIFLLAVYLLEAILEETISVDQAINMATVWAGLPHSERLFSWYEQSWERIRNDRTPEEKGWLEDFVTLLAAAQAPLGERQILAILNWKTFLLDDVQRWVTWLLTRKVEDKYGYKESYLQLRHQSVRDFLVSEEHQGPARKNLESMHARVGQHYLTEAQAKGWPSVEPYGRFYAVRHLLLAKDAEHLKSALERMTDLGYLQATLGEVGEESSE